LKLFKNNNYLYILNSNKEFGGSVKMRLFLFCLVFLAGQTSFAAGAPQVQNFLSFSWRPLLGISIGVGVASLIKDYMKLKRLKTKIIMAEAHIRNFDPDGRLKSLNNLYETMQEVKKNIETLQKESSTQFKLMSLNDQIIMFFKHFDWLVQLQSVVEQVRTLKLYGTFTTTEEAKADFTASKIEDFMEYITYFDIEKFFSITENKVLWEGFTKGLIYLFNSLESWHEAVEKEIEEINILINDTDQMRNVKKRIILKLSAMITIPSFSYLLFKIRQKIPLFKQ
jgi:hypothetical protein